jgi:hypothetical protein
VKGQDVTTKGIPSLSACRKCASSSFIDTTNAYRLHTSGEKRFLPFEVAVFNRKTYAGICNFPISHSVKSPFREIFHSTISYFKGQLSDDTFHFNTPVLTLSDPS